MSAPPGRSFPFPSRTSMYWETCHVTYDQAVEMFNAQTATQQAMGQNPIVSSTKLKRVKYSSIHEAQVEYSKQTIEKSLDLEKRILEVKETGNQSAKSLVDHINSYDAPTVDGIKGSDETKTKSVGEDASATEIAPPKVFTKSSKLPQGKVCAGDCRELATDTGDIAIYRSISASDSEGSKEAGPSDKNKTAGGSADVMVLGGLAATAGYRGAASLEMFLDRAAISAGTALAELSTYGLRFVGGVASAAVALFYSPSAGDSSYLNTEDILYRNRVNTLIRFTFDNEGKVHGYHLDLTEVPNRTVEKVGDNFVVELEPGITIEWFPEVAETDKGNVLVNPIPEIDPHNIYIYPEADQGKELDNTYITPVSDVEFNDYILTFPSETGISPLYIVYQKIPDKLIRSDRNFESEYNEKGKRKSHLKDGALIPADPNGKTSIQTHIRGSDPGKQQSPYTSTSAYGDHLKAKDYGDKSIIIDAKSLQRDIDAGIVENTEIISPDAVQKELKSAVDKAQVRYDNHSSDRNTRRLSEAKRDLDYAVRDSECLIKGCVPKEYITRQ